MTSHPGRTLDAISGLLTRLAGRYPQRTFSLASKLGTLRNRLTGRWPTVAEVQTLFPHLSRPAATEVAAGIGGLTGRNDVLAGALRRSGPDRIRSLISVTPSFRAMQGPLILASFHVGAIHALGLALELLGAPVLAFRHGTLHRPRAPLQIETTKGNEQQRAAAFHRALLHLTRGGFVMLALDVVPGASVEAVCLGRSLRLARGAFALSRMTGAPIVPFAGRWTREDVRIVVDGALHQSEVGNAEAVEKSLAMAAANWLERYLIESPSEITLGLLRNLLYGTEAVADVAVEGSGSPKS